MKYNLMTKSKKTTKQTPKQARSSKRKLRSTGDSSDALDAPAVAAAKMFLNPCGSELGPSVYPGDQGYMARFNSRFSGAFGAGETCNVTVFKPGNNLTYNVSTATGATPIVVAYVDTQAPGATFLNTNATKVRSTGACLIVQPIAAPNTATGVIYYGNVPASAVANGLNTTPDSLVNLCTQQVNVSQALMQPLEIKWSPGTFDDRYSPTTGITGDDDSDRNVILVITTGLVAATGLNYRCTSIYEWAPVAGIGIPFDSTGVAPSKCNIQCILRNLKRKDANWWWSLGEKALNIGKKGVLGYYSGGPVGAAMALATYR